MKDLVYLLWQPRARLYVAWFAVTPGMAAEGETREAALAALRAAYPDCGRGFPADWEVIEK